MTLLKFHTSISICACILALAGCGGGGVSPSTDTAQAPQTVTLSADPTLAKPVQTNATPEQAQAQWALLRSMPQTPLEASSATQLSAQQAQALLAVQERTPLASARAASNFTPTASTIAAALNPCFSISVGYVYNATIPAANGVSCYQFTVSTKAKIDSQVALPSGVTGNAYLYYVDPVSGQLTSLLDSDSGTGGSKILLTQAIGQNARLVLVVQPTSATSGQTFQLGAFNRPGFDAYDANDKPGSASTQVMNTQINANIDVAGIDQDYYFVPFDVGQTSVTVRGSFTANQSASFQFVQQISPNSYVAYSNPMPIDSASGNTIPQNYSIPSSNKNTTSTTQPFGILARVSGITTSAPAAEAYSLRVGRGDARFSLVQYYSREQINYGGGASYIVPTINNSYPLGPHWGISFQVTDGSNKPIPNEPVTINITGSGITDIQNLKTDSNGNVIYVPAYGPSACGISNTAPVARYFLNGLFVPFLTTISLLNSNISMPNPAPSGFSYYGTTGYNTFKRDINEFCNTSGG